MAKTSARKKEMGGTAVAQATVKARSSLTGQFRREPSKEELHREMQQFGHALRQDKAKARAFLVKAGILTPKGNLRKAYGG